MGESASGERKGRNHGVLGRLFKPPFLGALLDPPFWESFVSMSKSAALKLALLDSDSWSSSNGTDKGLQPLISRRSQKRDLMCEGCSLAMSSSLNFAASLFAFSAAALAPDSRSPFS